jgi:PKD repeat protein
MKKILLIIVILCGLSEKGQSQCSMVPVNLPDRLNNSSLVIEGKVIAKKSFWNSDHNYIFTSNLVEVSNVFKGTLMNTKLEIITDGGEVGLSKQEVHPALELGVGDIGVFTLNGCNKSAQFGYASHEAYADMQGFIKYDLIDNSATEPFAQYANIQTDLYGALETLLNIKIKPAAGTNYIQKTAPVGVAAVSGISPTTITAGTATSLTITGSGFGATRGVSVVEFRNADDGGATFVQPDASQYLSWSNTQIVVQVPSRTTSGTVTTSGQAGTGQVRVTVAGSPTLSAQTLSVSYGHINVYYSNTVTTSQIFNTRHTGSNGMGGMTWQMYTTFDANALAKASFLRAFQSWRCATYINWTIGSTVSTNTIALDGVNVIRFDVGAELPAGVLGRCTNYFSGCISGGINIFFYVTELDIVFDSGITWQYGPAAPTAAQYDFESVAVHELGHGHELTHVINTVDVMHYSISNGQSKRVLNVDDINGGTAVMARNISSVCSQPMMVSLNSTNCAFGVPTASFNVTSPVCVGQSVTLTDLSSGSPTSWVWTMAGGTPATATTQNTSTSYSTAGTKTITLIAANAAGTSTAISKT